MLGIGLGIGPAVVASAGIKQMADMLRQMRL